MGIGGLGCRGVVAGKRGRAVKLEPVLILLAVLVICFTVALFVAEKAFPNDGQIFQVISGLVTGFSGALLMRVKPRSAGDDLPEGSAQQTTTQQTTITPGEPKP
jgi:hypothetical protein